MYREANCGQVTVIPLANKQIFKATLKFQHMFHCCLIGLLFAICKRLKRAISYKWL